MKEFLGQTMTTYCLNDIYLSRYWFSSTRWPKSIRIGWLWHIGNGKYGKTSKQPASGFLMKDEIDYFEKAMQTPERPLVVIIGDAMANTPFCEPWESTPENLWWKPI